ncbi:MAG TPA: hypothetical protein DEO60_06305 [Bacteroidales bacterium]|jgi:hypothetical protein|nr:hypothetical protein [Bacteroidales bacterium]HBZ20720.1 hypothetical protein [Bacteroidales bacterium]
MRKIFRSVIFISILTISGCITQFVPETDEDPDLLVVEGLISDQPEVYTIKLSRSMPLGNKITSRPLKGCTVTIVDDLGHIFQARESTTAGTYLTTPGTFRGVIGRQYTLHINTNNSTVNHYSYQSLPMELQAVPPIDSLFHEKVLIQEKTEFSSAKEGSQVYLNTHDPMGFCKFYRWDFTETWKFRLPYYVPNNVCWITNNSNEISIKSMSSLIQNRISRFPIKFISNETDRLAVRYTILVNQYSLSESEYTYWEKLQSISEEVGSLYDITPSSIPGNIFCVEDPSEQVLGFFSVSGKTSKRIYIDENFLGLVNYYKECPADTIYGTGPIPGLNSTVWVIEEQNYAMPPYRVITERKFCADCTVRGTTTQPAFWEEQQ